MNLRRKKKLIIKLLVFLLIVGAILGFFIFIYPESNIPTYDNSDSSSENKIQSISINPPNVNVTLPTTIKTISPSSNNTNSNSTVTNTNSNNSITEEKITESDKTYESYVDDSIAHLITILSSKNELTILLSERSSSLIPQGSPTKIGVDYLVKGITEKIVSVYDFTVDGYSYPIVLLLSESGKVYYIDTELAYKTGSFEVSGQITDIPEIDNIHPVTVDNKYKSAVLVDKNDVGYEFDLDMINK